MALEHLDKKIAFEKWQRTIPTGSMAAAVFGCEIFATSRGIVEIIWGYLKDLWRTDNTTFTLETEFGRIFSRIHKGYKKLLRAKSDNQPPDAIVAVHRVGKTKFPKPKNININMMPFIYGDKESLPSEYHEYWDMIKQCNCGQEIGSVVFLTIHESIVKPGLSQRRGGVHVESPGKLPFLKYPLKWELWHPWGMGGWMLGERVGGIYMASTVQGSTKVWPCIIEDPMSNAGWYGDCEHLREILPEPIQLDANELTWITDRTPHESCIVYEGGYRQYFRLVTSEVAAWFEEHSTPNRLGVKPGIEIITGNKFDLIKGNFLLKGWRKLQKR